MWILWSQNEDIAGCCSAAIPPLTALLLLASSSKPFPTTLLIVNPANFSKFCFRSLLSYVEHLTLFPYSSLWPGSVESPETSQGQWKKASAVDVEGDHLTVLLLLLFFCLKLLVFYTSSSCNSWNFTSCVSFPRGFIMPQISQWFHSSQSLIGHLIVGLNTHYRPCPLSSLVWTLTFKTGTKCKCRRHLDLLGNSPRTSPPPTDPGWLHLKAV